MKKKLITLFYFIIILFINQNIFSQEDTLTVDEMLDISFSDLLEMDVSVASKSLESINDATGIITVISKKEIEGYASNNLGDILNRITGVIKLSANVFENNELAFRGQTFTPYDNHTLILLNGRPIRDPNSGGLNSTIYTSFPISIIDHIEIIRGPGSVLFG